MMHRLRKPQNAIGLIAALIVLCLLVPPMSAKSNDTKAAPQGYALETIHPKDVPALRDWARRWCQGWSVADLAAVFGVEATKEAIAEYLSEGLTGEARQVVVEACERELMRTQG